MWYFYWFSVWFRSSWSIADLLTVVSDRITRVFNNSGATQGVALETSKAFDRVWDTGLFTKLSLMEFQIRCLALFLLFSVIDGFVWFWMGSLSRTIQLMLEFLEAPFLVLHFSHYTLMTFLIMLLLILLYMVMRLRSTVSVYRHLICGNNCNLLLNLNLIYETLWAGNGLLISMLEKLN